MKLSTFGIAVALFSALQLTGCDAPALDPNSPAAINLEKGAAFMAENKKKEGVRTLNGGVQYEVIKNGSGHTVKMIHEVLIHYRGTHIDGSEFVNTYAEGGPQLVSMKGVIPGWRMAMLNMSEGSKWRLYIPPHLAFTDVGDPGTIEPNETVIFDLEVLEVK